MIGTKIEVEGSVGGDRTQLRREGRELARRGKTRAAEAMCQECKGRVGDE